jgi:hypothetical protein
MRKSLQLEQWHEPKLNTCLLPACRQIGGSDVLVLPMTYIFNEEPIRWRNLLKTLGLESKDVYQ